jgi:anti-anti-sigma factor
MTGIPVGPARRPSGGGITTGEFTADDGVTAGGPSGHQMLIGKPPEGITRVRFARYNGPRVVICHFNRSISKKPAFVDLKRTPGSVTVSPDYADGQLKITALFDPPGLRISGAVDASNVQALDALLIRHRAQAHTFVVDANHLDFIDVAGMRTLAAAAGDLAARGGRLVISDASPYLRRMWSLMGWEDAPGLTMPEGTRPS